MSWKKVDSVHADVTDEDDGNDDDGDGGGDLAAYPPSKS